MWFARSLAPSANLLEMQKCGLHLSNQKLLGLAQPSVLPKALQVMLTSTPSWRPVVKVKYLKRHLPHSQLCLLFMPGLCNCRCFKIFFLAPFTSFSSFSFLFSLQPLPISALRQPFRVAFENQSTTSIKAFEFPGSSCPRDRNAKGYY